MGEMIFLTIIDEDDKHLPIIVNESATYEDLYTEVSKKYGLTNKHRNEDLTLVYKGMELEHSLSKIIKNLNISPNSEIYLIVDPYSSQVNNNTSSSILQSSNSPTNKRKRETSKTNHEEKFESRSTNQVALLPKNHNGLKVTSENALLPSNHGRIKVENQRTIMPANYQLTNYEELNVSNERALLPANERALLPANERALSPANEKLFKNDLIELQIVVSDNKKIPIIFNKAQSLRVLYDQVKMKCGLALAEADHVKLFYEDNELENSDRIAINDCGLPDKSNILLLVNVPGGYL